MHFGENLVQNTSILYNNERNGLKMDNSNRDEYEVIQNETEQTVSDSADEGFDNGDNIDTRDLPETEVKPKKSMQREILEWILCIVSAVLIALIVRTYVFTFVNVVGSSMEPTIQNGDIFFTRRIMYEPQAGDVIILTPYPGGDPFIKRIIALENQVVNIDRFTGEVSVDGKVLEEKYIDENTITQPGGVIGYPYTVPEGHVFVLGDNRHPGGSTDSRSIGPIPHESIIGKASFRLWPLKSIGTLSVENE